MSEADLVLYVSYHNGKLLQPRMWSADKETNKLESVL